MVFSLGISNINNTIFSRVADMIENAINLFSRPKNSLNPNTHIISKPNIIINGNNASSLGNNLPSLIDTKPTNNNDMINATTMLITC